MHTCINDCRSSAQIDRRPKVLVVRREIDNLGIKPLSLPFYFCRPNSDVHCLQTVSILLECPFNHQKYARMMILFKSDSVVELVQWLLSPGKLRR